MIKRVSVLGCGSWGTAIVKVVADNVASSGEFYSEVYWYVRDEEHDDQSLTTWINKDHTNPNYLPKLKLPTNIIASSDIRKVVESADIIMAVYPPFYIIWLVNHVKEFVREKAYFVSFCKTDYMKLVITQDDVGVELCGSLKNVVAIAAGICDGLKLGDNTKADVIRIGFWEVSELMHELFPDRGTNYLTTEQSCGIAELFMCMSHKIDDISDIGDLDLLNISIGRRLSNNDNNRPSIRSITDKIPYRTFVDGAEYAKQIYSILADRRRTGHFPLFVAVHRICQNEIKPQELITCLQSHPIHA
ncbi:Glycerol-3-phosphate dehydrogenase, variant 4 [Schistosoma haematobium]|uniref:Glycerol-3-phosphate dehydrogenase [NAD(+)] n=1 Tax=Schistosoma haematobium TaxID=6185 RepID=A0A922S1M8_SCHHA|nr:Glycerol-3-phosphate dehydrogenase, variant 4 [Schistosoma haematobium]KAH9589910.1 Glycerol-3-phosphate dehydrogenase, variant 4 [Schistosoma haematobium]